MRLFPTPTEERISSALSRAAQLYVEDRSDPNGAVKTAALEKGLNLEMSNRLVEAFNISVIRSHIKTAEDKSSGIPIADKDVVARMLFADEPIPAERKAASVRVDGPSDEPVWSFGPSMKEASAPRDPGPTTGPDMIPVRILSVMADDERRASDVRVRKLAALDAATRAGERLATAFSSSARRHEFAGFQSEALSIHGEDAIPVLESVRKAAGIPEGMALKNPGGHAGRILSSLFHPAEVDLVGEILSAVRKHAGAAEDEAALEAELRRRSETITGRKSAADERPNWARDMIAYDIPGKSFQGIVRDTMLASDLVETPSARDIGAAQAEDLKADYAEAAKKRFRTDRGIEEIDGEGAEDLRAFAQSSVLSDLSANDEIIASYPPEEVEDAFANLARISPEAASNKSVARSVLRSVLAGDGAMDPFAADQIVSLQEKVMKTRGQIGAKDR